jgi:hypothetical protein
MPPFESQRFQQLSSFDLWASPSPNRPDQLPGEILGCSLTSAETPYHSCTLFGGLIRLEAGRRSQQPAP